LSCTINFTVGKRVEARIYRRSNDHPDGEDGVLRDLEQFFASVEEQTEDTDFDEPSYLAARFVVWQAARIAGMTAARTSSEVSSRRPLDFTGVGIVQEDRSDIAYRYFVDCDRNLTFSSPSPYAGRRPSVRWEEA
jgi:hypothetical protein